MHVGIVGAGLAGLACAMKLRDAGASVTLIEKSRGFGGRVASRRRDGVTFDHGLPAFDPLTTGTEISALEALPFWGERRVSVPTMNALPRALGENFETVRKTRITRIERRHGVFFLHDETGGEHGSFDRIVSAVPAPQAYRLLRWQGNEFEALGALFYHPCWTLMVACESASEKPAPRTPVGIFDSIFDETHKPERKDAPVCITAHATSKWSHANLERDPTEVLPDLLRGLRGAIGLPSDGIVHASAHRWRFAYPVLRHPAAFISNPEVSVVACGDWAGRARRGGDARGAWLSGEATAAHLLSTL